MGGLHGPRVLHFDLIFRFRGKDNQGVLFFNRAYLMMMNEFCLDIRQNDRTLKSCVEARASWSLYWTNTGAVEGTSSSAAVDMTMLPPDLLANMNQTQSLVKALQSQADADRSKRSASAMDDDQDGNDDEDGWPTKTKKRGAGGWKKAKAKARAVFSAKQKGKGRGKGKGKR